ncbi:MAG: MFS transporter [Candidatus Eremiobacter antarcticus]|nr:MFS transporter [Candidatus Eremiobacteraeota bacterium]PZR63692.1 MAG: MFS transporter [Candidatus Eremiobacter sp. RRmetagenome_bin22]
MNRRVLAVLSTGHLAVDFTAGALPATLPFLQREFHLSYFWVAALVMTSGVTSSILQPLFGIASDAAAARYLLPVGVLCALAGFAAIGHAGSYAGVLALVAMAGIGSAMYHPEGMKSARSVSGSLRTTGMSYFAVGGNVGVALGPLILTALIAARGLHAIGYLIVPAFLISALVATAIAPLRRAQAVTLATATAPRPSRPRVLLVLIAIAALRSLVYAGILTFVPLYSINVLHHPVTQNGGLLFAFLATGALATLIAGPLADRHGVRSTMIVSLALAPLALCGYLLADGMLQWIALALSGACIIGTFSTTVVLGQECLPNRVALASALLIGLTTGLGALGVAVVGRIADAFGLSVALWLLVGIAVSAFSLTLVLPTEQRMRAFAQLAGGNEA